jgi:hypothetical protein
MAIYERLILRRAPPAPHATARSISASPFVVWTVRPFLPRGAQRRKWAAQLLGALADDYFYAVMQQKPARLMRPAHERLQTFFVLSGPWLN